MEAPHIPVLLDEVLETFENVKGWVVDATIGYGGHTEALLRHNPSIKIIGIDKDEEAIAFSTNRLAPFKDRVKIVQGSFGKKIEEILQNHSIKGLLADIGVSSLQLDKMERGFSIKSDRLDMRMDKSTPFSARDLINQYSQEELERIFKEYAEAPNYKKIARLIIQHRPITSAKELADLIARHSPKKGKIHPATTFFQAIRIEVNKELEELEALLDALERRRPSGAKVTIITFHSLEDRIVKRRFRKWARSCICPPEAPRCECGGDNALGEIVTKKPITASKEEIALNPRSRSAKMRVFQFKGE